MPPTNIYSLPPEILEIVFLDVCVPSVVRDHPTDARSVQIMAQHVSAASRS